MSSLVALDAKLDALHKLIAEQVLPDLAVIKSKQENTAGRLSELDSAKDGRVTRLEKSQEKIINRTIGAFAVLSLAWSAFTFLYEGRAMAHESLPNVAVMQPVIPAKEAPWPVPSAPVPLGH